MLDVEPLILDELERLSTLDTTESGDWDAILSEAVPRRRRRRTVVWTAVACVVGLSVVIPAFAFSGTVRSLVGIHSPAPRYDQARLRVEVAPKHADGHDYVYRLWTSPSTQGGACFFTTVEAAPAPPHPKEASGGGYCSVGHAALIVPEHRLTWSLGTALGGTYVLDGVAGSGLHVSRMTLRWHGGSQRITTRDGYFLGLIPIALHPPFKLLPFDIVATDSHGRVVLAQRIPTSFLYPNWKRVKPELRAYRHAHGCNTAPPLWQCRSR